MKGKWGSSDVLHHHVKNTQWYNPVEDNCHPTNQGQTPDRQMTNIGVFQFQAIFMVSLLQRLHRLMSSGNLGPMLRLRCASFHTLTTLSQVALAYTMRSSHMWYLTLDLCYWYWLETLPLLSIQVVHVVIPWRGCQISQYLVDLLGILSPKNACSQW